MPAIYDYYKTPQMRVEWYVIATGEVLGHGFVDDGHKMKSRIRVMTDGAHGWNKDFHKTTNLLVGQKGIALRPAEACRVSVTIEWGKEWTGSYYKETPGRGIYVTVMDDALIPAGDPDLNRYHFPRFAGCPLGSSNNGWEVPLTEAQITTAVEMAINDFIARGRSEWKGQRTLHRMMVNIGKRVDYRKPKGAPVEIIPIEEVVEEPPITPVYGGEGEPAKKETDEDVRKATEEAYDKLGGGWLGGSHC